ncbi:MAG: hypothetical protein BA868_04135 [Desulfobacterales bacterium C00003106]|jgi:pyruvate,orthophosphate dikinase|nr:MAG: hypothetical protein BA868_04135 [Desulfobacterales bacterium C00003106]OEU60568.1 MAG: hypothetical protein BAW33_07425 [Desulfobacterales bacterium C00003104]
MFKEKGFAENKFASEALRRNLEETAYTPSIDANYRPLIDVIEPYPGLHKQTEAFLYELNHPLKNWRFIVTELKKYALRNLSLYEKSPLCPQVVMIICDTFFAAIESIQDQDQRQNAVEYLLFYLEKLAASKKILSCAEKELIHSFERLLSLSSEPFFCVVTSFYPLHRTGRLLLQNAPEGFLFSAFNDLLVRSLAGCYKYWLEEEDLLAWFIAKRATSIPDEKVKEIFRPVSHVYLNDLLARLDYTDKNFSSSERLENLLNLPTFQQIVWKFRDLPNQISKEETENRLAVINRLFILLKLMAITGLASVHEEVLRCINESLAGIIADQKSEDPGLLVARTFEILKKNIHRYPETALHTIQNIGRAVFTGKESDLADLFIRHTISLGFQGPEIGKGSPDAPMRPNPTQVLNIRVWMDIIENDPKWSRRLLSALVIYLKLEGVVIKDTDLFQKDITRFLNSDIKPVYNLAKQLTKLFPVYFNEIGAEGALRDVSTEIDEAVNRGDVLIHFFRKQCHVESSNLLIHFAKAIFNFWLTRNRTFLAPFLPPEMYKRIPTYGVYVDGVHKIVGELFENEGITRPEDLLRLSPAQAKEFVSGLTIGVDRDRRRVGLLVRLYRLLNEKYNLAHQDIRTHLNIAKNKGLPYINILQKAIERKDVLNKLQGILDYLKSLKRIILSDDRSEGVQSIYHKRHIAADIPSMYGTYYERKFDALGLTLRLENYANLLFEQLINSINLQFITRDTFFRITDIIHLFVQALELDGIASNRLQRHLKLLTRALEVRRFTFTQYVDIFHGLADAEQGILTTFYRNIHEDNIKMILQQTPNEAILPRYRTHEIEQTSKEWTYKIFEIFLRDLVASTFGFQYLDNFISRIIHSLNEQAGQLSAADLDTLLSYDPARAIVSIHHPHPLVNDQIYLGDKGYNLVRLADLLMPVPPGFIITTEVFRCRRIINLFRHTRIDLEENIKQHIARLEKETGKEFGNPENPLLFSVRSGAAISMPGMMDTFLNVGINEEIAEGLIQKSGKEWFAWDNYRRFLQSWGMSFGIDRETFHELMLSHKALHKVAQKRNFTARQMRDLAMKYKEAVNQAGVKLAHDPKEQLMESINQVFQSWHSAKSRAYREIMGISDNWGTAVIVQEMVFGNLTTSAGSGVFFTHNINKSVDRIIPWGDYTTGGQGEDVVAGLVQTQPISIEQKNDQGRLHDAALEEGFPNVFHTLREGAKKLIYERNWTAQEIEFTFEANRAEKCFILQSRDMVIGKKQTFPRFTVTPSLKTSLLAKGVGVCGGALSGKAVFTLNEIKWFRLHEPQTRLVLIRADTVPDDIREISAADGLLTSRGGATSHASIVAHHLGKTCVVGCRKLTAWKNEKRATISNHSIVSGDFLSIDGKEGSVYCGKHSITEQDFS